MKKRIFVIVVVIMMLLLMATPVSAVVTPPTTVKDALLKGIWGAIMDLQKQITALTQRVDNIQTSPMPEYRAGSFTTPSNEAFFYQTVTFSHPMPNTNYRVSITSTDPSSMSTDYCGPDTCFLIIDSKTTTGFTFSYRTHSSTIVVITLNHKFDYIAIADN
jgi:hypothetical protein